MVAQGINVILYLDNKILGGQLNAQLNRSVNTIDITNKIEGDWKEYLPGTKTWNVSCNGIYLVNNEALNDLEKAFIDNKEITLKIQLNNITYEGEAILIDFPLNTIYDSQFKYTIKLLGTGELKRVFTEDEA